MVMRLGLSESTVVDDTRVTALLVERMRKKAHPLLQEALFLAAVPHLYDRPFFDALRKRDDGRNEQIFERLTNFSFVNLRGRVEGSEQYEIAASVRTELQRQWIERNPEAYLEAHCRAIDYLNANPHSDAFIQTSNLIYHRVYVDGTSSCETLRATVSSYYTDRRLSEAERLLDDAERSCSLLQYLDSPVRKCLQQMVEYGRARLSQLRGDWEDAERILTSLREQEYIWTNLRPHIHRATGLTLQRTGQHTQAIVEYRQALALFRHGKGQDAEQAETKLRLGVAHVELAMKARGYREVVETAEQSSLQHFRQYLYLPVVLPLLIYMRALLGNQIWTPRAIRLARSHDWIIARLFSIGSRWYKEAAKQLRITPGDTDLSQVHERQAELYLAVGDGRRAEELLLNLLADTSITLGEYRRARIEVLLGQALMRTGDVEAAIRQLRIALPVMQTYKDGYQTAKAYGLLAEAEYQSGRITESIGYFERAIRKYHSIDDTVGATEIAERVSLHRSSARMNSDERSRAGTTTKILSKREYLVRFQHPVMVTFRRASLILLAAFIFFIPLFSSTLDFGNVKLDQIGISPNYDMGAPFAESAVDMAPVFLSPLSTSFSGNFAILSGLQLIITYAIIYLVMGPLVIARTGLQRVQDKSQATAIRIDVASIGVGKGKKKKSMQWQEVTDLFNADVAMLSSPMADNSAFMVASAADRIKLGGHTTWYAALSSRTPAFLPRGARLHNLGYKILKSPLGYWYVLSMVALLAVGILSWFSSEQLAEPLLGTAYSTADLYPFLYLGLILPPLIWAVYRPLRNLAYLRPRSLLPSVVFGLGLFILVLYSLYTGPWAAWIWQHTFSLQQNSFIYPPLLLFVAALGTLSFIWNAPATKTSVNVRRARLPISLVAIAILAFSVFQAGRYTIAYHLHVVANQLRDDGAAVLALGETDAGRAELQQAISAYDRSLELVPKNLTAIHGRSATYIQLQEYETALVGFDLTVQVAPNNVSYRFWRAITYHALGDFERALADYELVLEEKPKHVNALTGRG